MSKSDKPDIGYTFREHVAYVDAFLEGLSLDGGVILVVQDWGSGLGFHYARRILERVKGIVFLEAITRTIDWSEANFVEKLIFRRMRHPTKGPKMNGEKNFSVKRFSSTAGPPPHCLA